MNFNLIAVLFAACASFAAAVTDGQQEKLVSAPPVRFSKASSSKVSSSKVSGSSRKVSGSSRKVSSGSHHRTRSSSSSVIPRSSSLASQAHDNSKSCSRQLEAVLYSPPSTVKDYLAKIGNEMRTDIQVIMAAFAGGNLEYIRTYVNRYNILVTIAGPFGLPVLVTSTFIASTLPLKNVATAQTYSGRDGFYSDSVNNYYNYQFSMMSSNGQYITFILSLPLSAMANSPNNC